MESPKTALLVVDVQVGVVAEAVDRDAVVANVATLVDRARSSQTPVIWVLHDDDAMPRHSDDWQLVPELAMGDGEPVIYKNYGDAFVATDLGLRLDDLDVGHLIVAGAQSDACIISTLHGAVGRGYGATLVSDAHTTEDLTAHGAPAPAAVVAHTNMMWDMHGVPNRETGTVTTADAAFDS
ncbi:MAG: isochorismatase family protein [Actinomycetota bacterium]